MVYSVFIHDKHNNNWDEKSYLEVFSFNRFNDNNIINMMNNFENVNIIDYDVFISKNKILPRNENNAGNFRIDISIIDNQNRVIDTFKSIYNYLSSNDFVITLNKYIYKVISYGIILKDDLCCIRIFMNNFNDYVKKFLINTGKLSETDKIFSFPISNDDRNYERTKRYFYPHHKRNFFIE